MTGTLHADPHAGNLLKVRLENGSVTLGYLDFGLLSTIPSQVRDALVCSVVLQVFSRDIGELMLVDVLIAYRCIHSWHQLIHNNNRRSLQPVWRATIDPPTCIG